MRGYVFMLEVLLAVTIVSLSLALLDISYAPKTSLTLYRKCEDSLSVLKRSGRLQSQNPGQIQEVLNHTLPHYRLEIFKYDLSNSLQDYQVVGEEEGDNLVVAKATWVTSDYYYLVFLEAWQ